MKKAVAWILTLLLFAGGSFAMGRLYQQHHLCCIDHTSADLDNGFRAAEFPTVNRSFVIFICGFNNGAFLEKTLRSVFSQAYENYRLIYIDDASMDGSFELARECINQSTFASRSTFVHNDQRLGLLANLVHALQQCKDQEIVLILPGHDWLAHEWVLSQLNRYYADPDLWLTYGQFSEFPSYRRGNARNYQQSEWKAIRQTPLISNHLPSFYVALFKRIKESDLLFQGSFLPDSGEMAVMLPMLEMAKDHFQFIPEVLSISNQRAFILDNRDSEVRCERYVRSLNPYLPLAALHVVSEEELVNDQEDR